MIEFITLWDFVMLLWHISSWKLSFCREECSFLKLDIYWLIPIYLSNFSDSYCLSLASLPLSSCFGNGIGIYLFFFISFLWRAVISVLSSTLPLVSFLLFHSLIFSGALRRWALGSHVFSSWEYPFHLTR